MLSSVWPASRIGVLIVTIRTKSRSGVSGVWAEYNVAFTWLAQCEALHLACAFDLKVPERRRTEAAQLVAKINEQLWVGHFDVWSKDGVVMFRHAMLLAGGASPMTRNARRSWPARWKPASVIINPFNSSSGAARPRPKRWKAPCSTRAATHDGPAILGLWSAPARWAPHCLAAGWPPASTRAALPFTNRIPPRRLKSSPPTGVSR